MKVAAIIAVLTTVFSILVKVVGLPDQIKRNYRRKSTEGLSNWFVLSAFLSYVLWVVHGMLQHDMSLILGQGLGVLTTGVIMWQMFVYRHNKGTRRAKILTSKTPRQLFGVFVPLKRK